MGKRLALIIVLLMLVLSGCAPAAATQAPNFAKPGSAGATNGMAAPASAPQSPAEAQSSSDTITSNIAQPKPAAQPTANQSGANGKRLVVRNAELNVVVEDPGKSMAAISQMAESMGGFVVTSNLYKTTGDNGAEYPEAKISVRVPAEKLNEALDQIRAQTKNPGEDVRSENVSGQDVTKEYTDLQSRLTNMEDTEAQLREIMGSATKTEDVLTVYNRLVEIREQIEVTKGQIKYYEEAAALSSISILIQAQASVQPLKIAGWEPVGVARNAAQALIRTMQMVGSVAIWLIIYALPVGLVIYLAVRLLLLVIRRLRKSNKVPKPQPPAAPLSSNQ